jgi:RNA polymerase sigma factor (sigma-70 family)
VSCVVYPESCVLYSESYIIFLLLPVTFHNFIRLCSVVILMTINEYNRSAEEHADSVYRFIRGNIKDEDRANDIVQDSYERLWRHVAEIEYPVVKSWLFSTAYHIMIDIIRKEKRITNLEPEHEKELMYEPQFSDLNEILHEALDRLPEQQKTSVMLRDYEGYTYKEIGEITGLSEAQVKINIYRGRVALKNFIGKIETVL